MVRLREAVAARDEFISVVAHELRNPMTPIMMQVDALRRLSAAAQNPLPGEITTGLERLSLAAEHFKRRATMLLDVSRLTSGMFALEVTTVHLGRLLTEVVSRMSPVADRFRTPIRMNLAPDMIGELDPVAMEEIADNLISNAIKYGNGQDIDISLTREGRFACLSVRDRGIGISRENQARIFDRFERAVTRREKSGFGIGLWVVGQLVTAMKGTIEVQSKRGEGSVFTVRVPLGPRNEGEAA